MESICPTGPSSCGRCSRQDILPGCSRRIILPNRPRSTLTLHPRSIISLPTLQIRDIPTTSPRRSGHCNQWTRNWDGIGHEQNVDLFEGVGAGCWIEYDHRHRIDRSQAIRRGQSKGNWGGSHLNGLDVQRNCHRTLRTSPIILWRTFRSSHSSFIRTIQRLYITRLEKYRIPIHMYSYRSM
jgi:hypothetical protein